MARRPALMNHVLRNHRQWQLTSPQHGFVSPTCTSACWWPLMRTNVVAAQQLGVIIEATFEPLSVSTSRAQQRASRRTMSQ
jgi:hypothetical protein